MTYTNATKDTYVPPTCPDCGAAAVVEWVEATWQHDEERTFVPGMHRCSARCFEQLSVEERSRRSVPGELWNVGMSA